MLMTPPALHTPLADARGRRKRKLRLSLTDRCNLRCVYCMPEHPQWLPRDTLLDGAELQRLARLFVARLGISEIRLTGGEPLLRAEITQITAALDALRAEGLERLALTSNGVRLDRLAAPLRAAGLDDVNVSLDAVTPQGFARLTGGDLAPVLRGIDAARAAGLPVKINSVILRGHNEDEVLPLVRWALAEHLPLRFIEFMPLDGRGYWNAERVVREDEILAQLAPHYTIEAEAPSDDPAHYFRIDGRYALGMISTVSKPFCRRCDRVRVSATGRLYSCLFSADGPDLRTMLREGADDDAIEARMRAHVWHKEAGYAERPGYVERPITMHVMGG
ncbi:MAG: GTP 3',8-cyclase MoaA [Sinimarinibacterium flocculans]|uniref:GTP 3',8-cyclase MoaA n=1 Tax=Sinimarinibacterium flocculans TaxID=985250 RepID=UPI003C647846